MRLVIVTHSHSRMARQKACYRHWDGYRRRMITKRRWMLVLRLAVLRRWTRLIITGLPRLGACTPTATVLVGCCVGRMSVSTSPICTAIFGFGLSRLTDLFFSFSLSAGRKACIKRRNSEKRLLRKRIRDERIYGFKI